MSLRIVVTIDFIEVPLNPSPTLPPSADLPERIIGYMRRRSLATVTVREINQAFKGSDTPLTAEEVRTAFYTLADEGHGEVITGEHGRETLVLKQATS